MEKKTQKLIINALRKASIMWEGRAKALKSSRKKVIEDRPKLYWQCAQCLSWKRNSNMVEVDHIVEVGPFSGDWNDYINRLFCDQSNLQVLCIKCHAKKTSGYSAKRLYQRKSES